MKLAFREPEEGAVKLALVIGTIMLGLVILNLLGGCAPLFIAAGVEIEHDEWCRTHQTDWHCR